MLLIIQVFCKISIVDFSTKNDSHYITSSFFSNWHLYDQTMFFNWTKQLYLYIYPSLIPQSIYPLPTQCDHTLRPNISPSCVLHCSNPNINRINMWGLIGTDMDTILLYVFMSWLEITKIKCVMQQSCFHTKCTWVDLDKYSV